MKAILVLLVASVAALPAQSQTVRASDPLSLVRALQSDGYQATLTTDSAGDPRIRSGSGGINWSIWFYGCRSNSNCTSVQFSAGFDMRSGPSMSSINEWNRSRRFGQAFLDSDGDPFIQWDMNLDRGGVSRALFLDSVDLWASALAAYVEHIGFD